MGRLNDLKFHDGCDDSRCPICSKANAELCSVIDEALGSTMDWVGRYFSWLTKQGIDPQTDGGWWSREALSDANVQRFIEE